MKKMKAYWLRRAEGGVGCIIVDAIIAGFKCSISSEIHFVSVAKKVFKNISILPIRFINMVAKIIPQITHPGPRKRERVLTGVAPVASIQTPWDKSLVKSAIEELPGICRSICKGKFRCTKERGFDGIELPYILHMLLGSFL